MKYKKLTFILIFLILVILNTIAFQYAEWEFEVNLGGSGLTFPQFAFSRSVIDWIGNGLISCVFSGIIAIIIYYLINLAQSNPVKGEISSNICLVIAGFIFGIMSAFGLLFAFGFNFLNARDITGVYIIPGEFMLTMLIWGINLSFVLIGIFVIILYIYDPF